MKTQFMPSSSRAWDMAFEHTMPGSARALRETICRGVIFHLPANDASRALSAHMIKRTHEFFPEVSSDDELRRIQYKVDLATFFKRATDLRSSLCDDLAARDCIYAVMNSLGFAPEDHAVEVLRFRAVLHELHLIPEAKICFYVHRDTWVANPPNQINWWIPLFDLTPEQTLGLYPELFDKPVNNNSDQFDHDEFTERAAKENYGKLPPPVYPHAMQEVSSPTTFAIKASEILLFSAQHLHATLPNSSGETRFSVDFRTVHRAEFHDGMASPNVDNQSTGNVMGDYPW